MKCPYCGSLEDRVIDSRTAGDGASIRRRRVCQDCARRFTTYERIEEIPRFVCKKDRSREPFHRQKVLAGLMKACEKRPVPIELLEGVVDRVERHIQDRGEPEIDSREIGEMLIAELKRIDQVAYVRFASVYQEFADVSEFMKLVEGRVPDENAGS
jgi:transcriptional repressor NrdR